MRGPRGTNGILLAVPKKTKCEVLVLCGLPSPSEPIYQQGPFVTTTEREVSEAIVDWRLGRNGFEGSRGWRSDAGRATMNKLF